MDIKKLLLATAATITLGLSVNSFAAAQNQTANGAHESTPANNPWYADANVGYGWTSSDFGSGDGSSLNGIAGNVNVGYSLNPTVSVEGGFTYAHTSQTINGISAHINSYAFDIAVKGIMPITDKVGLFAKVGPGLVNQKFKGVSGTNTHLQLFYAAGFDYTIKPNLTAQVQFMGFTGSDGNGKSPTAALNAVMGGIGYHFA